MKCKSRNGAQRNDGNGMTEIPSLRCRHCVAVIALRSIPAFVCSAFVCSAFVCYFPYPSFMMPKLLYTLFVVLLLSGCSGNLKLGGKVSFPDGEPLSGGTIIFSNSERLARAFIKPDGTYDVGSLSEKDGLPPGKYKVYITGAVKVAEKRKITLIGEGGATTEGEEDILESLIAEKYTHRDTTPLEIDVPGERVYNITVERP